MVILFYFSFNLIFRGVCVVSTDQAAPLFLPFLLVAAASFMSAKSSADTLFPGARSSACPEPLSLQELDQGRRHGFSSISLD